MRQSYCLSFSQETDGTIVYYGTIVLSIFSLPFLNLPLNFQVIAQKETLALSRPPRPTPGPHLCKQSSRSPFHCLSSIP